MDSLGFSAAHGRGQLVTQDSVLQGAAHTQPDGAAVLIDPLFNAPSTYSAPGCLCSEGWGPVSPWRYDLTPCFLDVWVAVVAAWGILGGIGALWLLLKYRLAQPVKKNWHFYAKLILIAALIGTTAAEAALQIAHYGTVFFGDFRYWATVSTVIALGFIFAVQYYEHWRSRQPNGVALVFWALYILVNAVKLRSLVARKVHQTQLPYFVVFTVSLALAIFEFILEEFVPKQRSDYDALGADEDECPYERADIFSVLTFSWMTPLMKFGYHHFVTQDDLWNVRKRDRTKAVSSKLSDAWRHQVEHSAKPSLWMAMTSAFYGPYLRASLIKVVSDILNFTQPQLLRMLIRFIDSYRTDEPQPTIQGVAIALAMFIVSVTQTSCLHQYFQRAFETAMRLKGALTAIIYDKSLKLSNEGRATKSTGDIVNHMAVDQQRISDLAQFGIQVWSAPFQIILCMISLYDLVGVSMMAGIAVMVLMVPLNTFLAKMMKSLQVQQMKNKDTRSKLMTEILNNMKSIKLYAWSTAFMNKLNYIRNDLELNTLRKIGATQSLSNFFWTTTPFLVSCSTFAVFVLVNNKPLTTEIVFPALTLFNLLTFPLSVFPMVITSIISACVAANRIEDYLLADELQPDAVTYKDPALNIGDEAVRVREGTFTWNRYEPGNALENISFSARKGELTCVVGRVGAGKSSLLQALLGDLYKREGEVIVRGKIAYVSQSAWIMNASVRDNITFGHRWDQELYDVTVECCALLDDFKTLPDGDLSEVGERGISLSGGQKARLSLARAVYARADVYLLDDCLSAVDGHVGRHIINRVLGRNGILKTKCRILATNSIPVLKEADFIGLLRNGQLIERGTYEQLLAMKGEIANLIRAAVNEDEGSGSDRNGKSFSPEASAGSSVGDDDEFEEVTNDTDSIENGLEPLDRVPTSTSVKSRRASWASLRRASTISHHPARTRFTDEEDGPVLKTKQAAESMEQGKVKWSVYGAYAKASNLGAVAVYLTALVAAQAVGVLANFWLKKWSEANERAGTNPHVGKYIGVYLALGVGSAALVIIQTLILWIFCSIEASRKLHEKMAYAVFRSPMTFFETTPTGRILNRFSSDIYRIDELLSRTFNMLFANSGRALFTMVVIVVGTPWFAVVIVPLAFVYLSYQKYYLRTSRELKRLDSITRSPIYAHFQESLGGLPTIRAFRQQKRFTMENELRMDLNQPASPQGWSV
ncbi:hypothetical protein KEM52_003513 [Ascosphaera acerosa]|nr:hypothetical protein KEM52_003513 [Ascosphaera acerosa]